jgi:AraC-like DNA-binding protein
MRNQILHRFLGEEVRILSTESVVINNFITTERLRIQLIENPYKEELGTMLVDVIDDGGLDVHLFYLIPQNGSAEAIVYKLQFLPEFFNMFGDEMQTGTPSFRFHQSPESEFMICQHSRLLIAQMQQITDLSDLLRSFHYTELAIQLLRRAIEHVSVPFSVCPVPACRFLAFESEREKIIDARKILEQSFDQLISIKDLSRKVAMNECYLKKGFKTLTGKTINEFQQELRICKAKELLQQHGQTVSEVANTLGYSSISHFSTAFKKATGIKPCELLV